MKQSLSVFIAVVLLTGLPLWLVSYTFYLNHRWISELSIAICAVAGGLIAYKTVYKKRTVVLFSSLAHQVALIIKILIDIIPDKTNHNLAPFEMVLLFIADLAVVSLTVLIGRAARTRRT